MNDEQRVSEYVKALRKAAGLLAEMEDERAQQLRREVIQTCDRVDYPAYRVVVFGPFNYGKSTLLNALIGQKTLPMDLVPTTGAAITLMYGQQIATKVTHTDGSMQETSGTDALSEVAILDEHRQMRPDIADITVTLPHPLLQLGMELVDLPGTDDQIAQESLVQQQLLSADLVIQVLDGRKLMTLLEREQLRDWLLDRGINTVIFVVNFLNLMTPEERQQVGMRVRFLAESFRANLPDGVSNLYLVDALPALRARIKGEAAAAAESGLPMLETALQTIGAQIENGRSPGQLLPRLNQSAEQVLTIFQHQLTQTPSPPSATEQRKREIQVKALALLKKGFEQSCFKLRRWLEPSGLQAYFRQGLADAIENNQENEWLSEYLYPAWEMRQHEVTDWVTQAREVLACASEVSISEDLSADLTVDILSLMEPLLTQSTPRRKAQEIADSCLCQFCEASVAKLTEYQNASDAIFVPSLGETKSQTAVKQLAQYGLIQSLVDTLTQLKREM